MGFALVLGLCGASTTAWAASAILLESSPNEGAAAAEQAKLRAAAEGALRTQKFSTVPAADVEVLVAGEPQLKGCVSELCRERLGKLLDSQIVIGYHAKAQTAARAKHSDWHFTVDVVDVEVGAIGANLSDDCAACTVQKAGEKLAELVSRVVSENAARRRGVIEVTSTPASAAVFVDGTELGITPYKRAAFAGPHKLVLRHVGFRSEQVETIVSPEATKPLTVTLSSGVDPVKVVVVEREKAPIYKKWWFWVAVGGAAVAVGAVAAGVAVAAQKGPSSNNNPDLPANTYMFMF